MDLNDVTAAPFSVSSSQLPAAKKNTQNGAVVTSLRSFLLHDEASTVENPIFVLLALVVKLL